MDLNMVVAGVDFSNTQCCNVDHGIAQCQRQLIRLAQPQHLGQVALGIYIHQQNLFALYCQPSAQVVHRGAFSHTALLVCNGNYFRFCQGFTSLNRFSRLQWAGGYVG